MGGVRRIGGARARRARVAAAAVLVALGLAACDPTPDQDTFYTAPADTSGAPGTVIRARPSRFTLDPVGRTPVPGVNAQQIVYRSTNALGQPMAVSGTVLVPTAPYPGPGPRPLVAYAVGTRGVGDACAPSYTLSQGTDYEGLFINNLLSQGWVVAVSDYEGLGMPGQHTYVIGQSEGRALLDVARAAIRLPGTGLSASTPVGLAGYSQGGGAAGWAAQLESTYAPELDVRGTAAGGIPGDLLATAEFVDGTPFVAVELLAAIGLDAAYPELDLEDHLNAEGEQLLQDAGNVCLVSVDGVRTLFSTVFTSRSDYTTSDILTDPAWLARLQQNRLGGTRPAAPVFQYHGGLDEIVPFPQAADLRREWCNRGARVTWSVLPGEHVLGLVEGQPLVTAWLQARFAGIPSLGNCLLP